MSLSRKRLSVVGFMLGLMIVAGVVVIICTLTLFGIMHADSSPRCTSEVSTNALASIGLKSSGTPRAELCSATMKTPIGGSGNGGMMDAGVRAAISIVPFL